VAAAASITQQNNLVAESADNVAADASIPTTGNVQPDSRYVLSSTQVVLESVTGQITPNLVLPNDWFIGEGIGRRSKTSLAQNQKH
jgi:hypothetical protein